MESAKLVNTNTHQSPAPQRVAKSPKDAARSNGGTALAKKKAVLKPKAEKLVCRYCGSADLAPSFIKRHDRRCRKCFGQRYGSACTGEDREDQKVATTPCSEGSGAPGSVPFRCATPMQCRFWAAQEVRMTAPPVCRKG